MGTTYNLSNWIVRDIIINYIALRKTTCLGSSCLRHATSIQIEQYLIMNCLCWSSTIYYLLFHTIINPPVHSTCNSLYTLWVCVCWFVLFKKIHVFIYCSFNIGEQPIWMCAYNVRPLSTICKEVWNDIIRSRFVHR